MKLASHVVRPTRSRTATHHRIIVGDIVEKTLVAADSLQDVPAEDRHAARGDGHAQPVGGQQEARLMAVDVGALHLGGEALRLLASLERQHEPDLVRQLRRGRAELAGVERDAGIAQRHDRPARRLQALAHVVQLGIEGVVAADQDRCVGPVPARLRSRLVELAGHADQDFGTGARQLRQPPEVELRCVMGAASGATTLKSVGPCRGGRDGLRRSASAALAHCTSVAPAHQPRPIQNRRQAAICHHAPAEKRWTSSFSIASAR